jgi:serine/threonine-protein kinase RsbW
VSARRRSFQACVDSVPLARRAAVAWARAQRASDEVLQSIALAVTEAATNVVVHAYRCRDVPGTFTLELDRDADGLRVSVSDDGEGMAPRADSPGLGLGMPLIASVTDKLEILSSDSGGTQVRMRFGAPVAAQLN